MDLNLMNVGLIMNIFKECKKKQKKITIYSAEKFIEKIIV